MSKQVIGDRESVSEPYDFKNIYDDYGLYVRRCIYWMVGAEVLDDLVQETFVKVWKYQSKFQSRSNVKTWIYRIAVNVAIDHLRKKKLSVSDFAIENIEAKNEQQIGLAQAIDKSIFSLPVKQRSVFNLYYKMEMDIKEVSEALEIAEGTVKSRLFKARKSFILELKKNGVDYEPRG